VPDLRPVLFTLGLLLLALAAAMLLPALADILTADAEWGAFVGAAAVTGGVGGALMLGYRQSQAPTLRPREGFLLTALAWVALCTFSTLPMMLSDLQLSFADAFFEAMSGLTTTGATVMSGLDTAPRGLLLWRSLLHLIGGIGIIVMAVAILPMLRVGGMQIFRMESSDKSEKIRPRVSQVSAVLISVYMTLVAVCALALAAAGMSSFDAVNHAMSAISTGGFSTRDLSIGYYRSPAIEWILTVAMALGGTTFVLLARAAQGDLRAVWRDTQARWYAAYLIGAILVLSLWQVAVSGRAIGDALRSSSFNLVSVATTTGFSSEDFLLWGPFPTGLFMVVYFIGGCTGSTAGGIKVFRYCVLGSVAHWQIRHLVHPNRVQPPTYNGKVISDEVVRSVLSFFVFYVASFAILTVAVSAFGLDLVTAMSGVAQALGNIGPGLTPPIGPVGNYAWMPDGAKWLLALAMLLGRLELLTVIVLFSPTYWRG